MSGSWGLILLKALTDHGQVLLESFATSFIVAVSFINLSSSESVKLLLVSDLLACSVLYSLSNGL